jgi:hypothetical protein
MFFDCVFGMLSGMDLMSVGQVRMVSGGLVVAGFMMRGGFVAQLVRDVRLPSCDDLQLPETWLPSFGLNIRWICGPIRFFSGRSQLGLQSNQFQMNIPQCDLP